MKQLSIVIVNYNVAHFLVLCLDSVCRANSHLDAEIIVVDNASSDESCALVQEQFPNVILIANKDNVGFAAANNQGVAAAQGEYVCILNPDTVVGETVFDEVYAFAKAHTKAGAIGARLVDGTGKFLPECKRNLPTPKVAFQKLFGSGDTYYARATPEDGRGAIQVLVGAFMFMRRQVYNEAGGFDEQYFMYGEDIDLSHTIDQLGYTNYYLGDQVVVHFKGESTAKDAVYRKRFYNAMHIFYNKHLKRNALEAALVNMGLWYAQKFHRNSKNTEERLAPTIKKYSVISKNKSLIETIGTMVNAPLDHSAAMMSPEPAAQYLLDMEALSYQESIQYMVIHRDQGLTFKFIPKNTTFALGSNSSDGRGERLQW